MSEKKFENLFQGASPKHFEFAKTMRKNPTPAEDLLWNCLSNKQIQTLKFRRQHPVSSFILDFYCHEIKLAIELDGEIHNDAKQHEYDTERTKSLTQIGITEIRFKNDLVINDIAAVLNEIEKVVREMKSKPLNPLKGT